MERIERDEGGRATFLPTIPKSSLQARHPSSVASHGSLEARSKHAPSTEGASQKDMAALQRNYESMSSVVQLCQMELSQAQQDVDAERAARKTLESDLAQQAASRSALAAELAAVSAALQQKESVEEELRRCQLQNQELRSSSARLSQDVIDASQKLEEEQKRSRKLRQSDSRQNSMCLALQEKLDKATKAEAALKEREASVEAELRNMQKLMAGASDSIHLLEEEKGELQAASGKHRFAFSQATIELEGLRAAIASNNAAAKALEAQIEAAQERGLLLERQLGMKTADWAAAHAQLDHSRKEASDLRAAEQELVQQLARAQKQAVLLTAQVADLGEGLDKARAATACTDEDLQTALAELTTTRAMLAQAQREAQLQQQAAREAEQGLRSSLAAAARASLEAKERFMQERQAWTHVAREQQVLVDRSEQQCTVVAEQLLSVLQRHEASMDSASLDLQQQVSCWVASLSQIQASQSKALADADTCSQTLQRQLGVGLSYMKQASAEELAAWKKRAGLAEERLAAQGKEHERVNSQQTKRYAAALADQHERFAAKVQCLQSALDDLRGTSAADGRAWTQRLQSEVASLRQQGETRAAAALEDARQLRRERDVAHGQLTVLSKQHQAALRERDAAHRGELDAAAALAERERVELLAALGDILAGVRGAEAALAQAGAAAPQAAAPGCHETGVGEPGACGSGEGACGSGEGACGSGDGACGSGEGVLLQLQQAVLRVAEACRGVQPAPRPQASSRLVLPELSDQERTLRATLDTLVKAEESLECNYTCMRCLCVFDDPVACVPCGHCFCRGCWKDPGGAKQACHECHQHIERVVPATNLDRLASKFEFKLRALQDVQRMCEGTVVTAISGT